MYICMCFVKKTHEVDVGREIVQVKARFKRRECMIAERIWKFMAHQYLVGNDDIYHPGEMPCQ